MKRVGRAMLHDFEENMGYEKRSDKGLTMADDFCVSYGRARVDGKLIYFIRHSCIEYFYREVGC